MANLATAAAMVDPTNTTHKAFRDLVRVGLWYVARQKRIAGGVPVGPEADLVVRVLRGDTLPVDLAVYAAATDAATQDQYVAGGNKLTDAQITNFLTGAWAQLAWVI